MKWKKVLLWASRVCLVAATLAILYVSYYHNTPRFTAPSLHSDPRIALALQFGGPCIVLTLFSWFWPGTGGVLALIFGGFTFGLIISMIIAVPHEITMFYAVLFGLFLLGSITSIVYGCMAPKPETRENLSAQRAIWLARIGSVASVILCLVIYLFVYPAGFWFGAIFGIFLAFAGWKWPAPGGLLMLLAGLFIIPLADVSYDFKYVLPAYFLLVVFAASGALNIWGAWKLGLLRYG